MNLNNYKILVTGGTGYIGSHTSVKLLQEGFSIVLIDNLSNSSIYVLNRIRELSKANFDFIEGDIRDKTLLKRIFKEHKFDAVIHLAGLKAVGESEREPLNYFENNVGGSLALLNEMNSANVNCLVFSSSATVYGEPIVPKCNEQTELSPKNIYGQTKLIVEDILISLKKIQPKWKIVNLRYFNPIGAHPSGLIGEDPSGEPNNLLPYISQVAIGKRDKLFIFGDDYNTNDGSGRRDYIHIQDLADGHIAALKKLLQGYPLKININLGTGKSYSVFEVIDAFEKASSKRIPFEIISRRKGDISEIYADNSYAKNNLDWSPKFDINDMCKDAWRWQSKNPNGYSK
tara:strand:- start:534 stop:1565 length:1032 start_codon:yes stop_codon:yes gene_type:complete